MTPTEINEAIAKDHGWTKLYPHPELENQFYGVAPGWRRKELSKILGMTVTEEYANHCTPDYHVDLNAMHEVEKKLSNSIKWEYLARLHTIMQTYHTAELVFAPAVQRAEAYLRVKGLWV